jgi:PAS domain S-box-containing protein
MSGGQPSAPLPPDEHSRLAALRRYDVLDSTPDRALDDLAHLASSICGTPIALVTLIDEDRQWLKANVGLAGTQQTPRHAAFCAHTILRPQEMMVVEDATRDRRFAENPSVTGEPNIRFYAGAPLLTPDGHALGALCVIDRTPRNLTDEQYEALGMLARQAQAQLELRRISRELWHQNELLNRELEDRRRRQIEHARLAAIIECSDDAILSMSPDGTVESWNPGAERIYGYTADQMVGRRIHDLVPPERRAELEMLLRTVANGEHVTNVETVRCRSDGTRFDAAVTASPITQDDETCAISWIVRDISTAKAAEREKTEALALQQVAIEELRRANEIKNGFVGVVGHEFRTPLTVIQGFSELLATEDFSRAEIREYASDIYDESSRLTRLITDMLDLDRMESGRMRLELSPLDLNELVAEVAARSMAAAPGHRLDIDLAADAALVSGDADRLRQVMTNLLSNAVKYSPGGGTVRIRSHREGGTVHLSVADEGLGIDAGALERIFDRYARAGTPRDRTISGTGLGLAISRQIVELHGGLLRAVSEPGEGSIFHLTLLAAQEP